MPPLKHPRWALALLATAQLIIALDATIIFVALHDMGRALQINAQQLQWVVSAYTVAFGGSLLLGGRAADLIGRRRFYRLGMLLFALASLLGALAPNATLLIIARAAQGIGAALLFPATLALINTLYAEGPVRNRALAIWSMASAVGLALGTLLGGVLTQAFGWPAVLAVIVPLATACAVAAGAWLPADGPRAQGRAFDLAGCITVTLGGSLLVTTLVQGPEWGWTAPATLGCLLLSVLLYIFTPWTAINLVDFYIVRKGHYSIAAIFDPDGIYGRWNARGLIAYLAGFLAMVPFFSTHVFTGPVARALGGADISMLIGLPVSALAYLVLCRNVSATQQMEVPQHKQSVC